VKPLPGATAADALRVLQQLAGDFAALGGGSGVLPENLAERYRCLFAPDFAAAAGSAAHAFDLAASMNATRRFTELLAAIATDAGARFTQAIAQETPGTPAITSLRELFELWIACGEAAWTAAAHTEEFAAAQADVVAAIVEQRRLRRAS
jgi:hypothetical protein